MAEGNYFTDKRSMIEMDKIIRFAEQLIIKDQSLADAAENLDSSVKSYELTRVMLRADNLTNYSINVSDIHLVNPTKNTIEKLTEIEQNRLLELKRFQVYTSYFKNGEKNSYYNDIYQKYIKETEPVIDNLDDFISNVNIPFFVAARLYQNFSILYYPEGILNSNEIAKFKESYNYALNYFMHVCYNEAFRIDNGNYDNLCKLMIIFIAIERYINSRMENMDDIDLFDEYSIRNLFLSYGLDYFFDFPLKYQKRILKNINYLIKNKGTTKAVINVLDIFGFDNIRVMKYYLCKEYEKDVNGNIQPDKPHLYFYGMDAENNNIEQGLRDPNTVKYEYEEFVHEDKYWRISSENSEENNYYPSYLEVLKDSFNFIYSKYISIDSFMNLHKFGLDFSNFASLLFYIQEKYQDGSGTGLNKLYFYDYAISPKKISLFHSLLLLYSLVMRKFGYKDNIIKTPSSICRVNGYNYRDLIDDVYTFTSKYVNKDYKQGYYDFYLKQHHLTKTDLSYQDFIKNHFNENDYNEWLIDYKAETDKSFEEYLKRYNLKKEDVILNYFIGEYIKLNISKNEINKIIETYSDVFDNLSKQSNIDSIVEYFTEYHSYPFYEFESLEARNTQYLFNAYVDINYIKNKAEQFMADKITTQLFDDLTVHYSLSDELFNLTKKLDIGEIPLDIYKLQTPAEMDYRKNLAYYYVSLYLETVRHKKKFMDYQKAYKLLAGPPVRLSEEFYNGELSEEDYRLALTERGLSFNDIYFKFLTSKFLNQEFDEDFDRNIASYREKMNQYNFDSSLLLDEINHYRDWYKSGLITLKEVNDYLVRFNTNPSYDYYTEYGITKHEVKHLNSKTIKKYRSKFLKKIDNNHNMTENEFTEIFKTDNEKRKEMEDIILKTNNYHVFRKYQALYHCFYTSNYRFKLFGNYDTFYDYLTNADKNLANYIDKLKNAIDVNPADEEELYNQYILEVCNAIESYLQSDEFSFLIQGNTILNDYIKDMVYQLIDFIKSYTIQLREISTILVFDDKFHNTFFLFDDDVRLESTDKFAELININDIVRTHNDLGVFDVMPTPKDLYTMNVIFNVDKKDKHLFNIRDVLTRMDVIHKYSDLLSLTNEAIFDSDVGLVDSNPDFKEVLKNFIKLSQKDDFNLDDSKEVLQIENYNHYADLVNLLCKVEFSNEQGLLDIIDKLADKIKQLVMFRQEELFGLDSEKIHFFNENIHTILLNLIEQVKLENNLGMIDVLNNFIHILKVKNFLTIKDTETIKFQIDLFIDLINKRSELLNLNDKVSINNRLGFIDSLKMQDKISIRAVMNNGAILELNL